MPAQTTGTDYIYFPDSAQLLIKAAGDVAYTDLGAIEGDIAATLNWEAKESSFANAALILKKITKMTMASSFTLNNLNPVGVAKLGAGFLKTTTTAGTANTTAPDIVIPAGWADNKAYDLVFYTSSTDNTKLRSSAKPTLTSVTLGTGSPETLTENTDYVVVASGAYSGWSIQFISAGMAAPTPTTYAITINPGSITPIASTKISGGSTSKVLTAFEMMFKHTDSAGKIRSLYLPSCTPDSGGFQFSFMSALADGVEKMPIALTANLDPTKLDDEQLFEWVVETGAA